ncbi:MAG TPA: glucosaminidase domain-containing protein [Propionibacteriaceae bacterium]|nr:glucosaminidase domain-containing protein [Propionibacteriaceae bacterium]
MVRTRAGGGWTDWLSLEEEEAGGGGRLGTAAVYVGDSDGAGVLGFPSGDAHCTADACSQPFEKGGGLYWTPQSGAWESYGPMRARYGQIGWQGGVLGYPNGPVSCSPEACAQSYQGGALYWTVQTGAWENVGSIRDKYGALGYQGGALGWPTGGVVCDQPAGGCWQVFQGGILVAAPMSVAYLTSGSIAAAYRASGLAGGLAGYPVADIQCTATGCSQAFERGVYAGPVSGVATFTPATTSTTDIFINSIAGMAQQSQATHKVPASVTIAQAILETGWGRSTLSMYAQNYFGIKCKATPSPYQSGCMEKASLEDYDPANPVTEVSPFRVYASVQDSFVDHGYFLATNSRYAAAFTTTSADDFIRAVAAAGYATDPAYPTTLISIMQRYNLYRFDQGVVPVSTPVAGSIGTAYLASGGPSGALSFRVTPEGTGPVPDSTSVSFNKGMIVSTVAYGAHALTGAIWTTYRLDGYTRNALGAVTSDQYELNGGAVQDFVNGRAYVRGSAAYVVSGDIWSRYKAMGAQGSSLGYPTGSMVCSTDGCSQGFEMGGIYWTAATGAWENLGPIRVRYAQLGWQGGSMGWPTGPMICSGDGCSQGYQGGGLYWSAATGAWESTGPMRARYGQLGWQGGSMGWPTGPVTCTADGCSQGYQGGGLYWSAATGAWESTGPIRVRYSQLGWQSGRMGWPTGPVTCGLTGGECRQTYQGGSIWWSASRGAWETTP